MKQQTRRWDDNKDASFAMRSKENAQDYRYFPEPDLPPMEISQAFIDAVRARQPELAEAKIARYQREFGLPEYDARILTEEKPMAELFERAAAVCGRAKEASNWIMGETMAMMKEKAVLPENLTLSGDALGAIIRAAADGASAARVRGRSSPMRLTAARMSRAISSGTALRWSATTRPTSACSARFWRPAKRTSRRIARATKRCSASSSGRR